MFKEIKETNVSKAHKKLVHGVGINDADYIVQPIIEGKRICCPFYKAWRDMIARCYSKRLQEKRPTYKGCSACKEWLTFSNFKTWMVKQDWQGNHLDKDLVKQGNKIYSPEFCLFVSPLVNGFLHENNKTRGAYPMGVAFHKASKKFTSTINFLGKQEYLGLFDNQIEAETKYLERKVEAVSELISRQKASNVIEALNGKKSQYENRLKELKLNE